MPAESDLVRDASSLLRFIRSVCFRKEDLDRTHRQSTGTFFDYLANLESATDQYLQRLAAKEPNPIALFASLDRENLLNFRLFWNRAARVREAST
jgi:hypothetical protein